MSNEKAQSGQVILVAFRFLVFGVGGFLLTLWSSVFLLVRIFPSTPASSGPNPIMLAIGSVAGCLMMLWGVGEWRRWRYLLVFASIPGSMLLYFLPGLPQSKEIGILIPAVAAVTTYAFVHRSYVKQQPSLPSDHDGQ